MPRFRLVAISLSVLSILILSSFCFAQQASVLVTQPVDNSVRTILKGNIHPLARAEYDQGEVPASMPLHRMLLVLKRSDQQETVLRRLIENQQFKNSPSYHQWLTPQQFGAQFGPADADIATVVNWLTASGFEVTQVSNGRTVIEFNGTAGQVKQAFGTALHKYLVKGEEHLANSTNPSIPTALASVVAGIDSLHDFRKKPQNVFVGNYSEKTKQLKRATPEYTFAGGCSTDNNLDCFALGPYDFATVYDLLPLWNATPTAINGAGQTIAIVGETDIDPTDATDFWTLFGLDGTHAPQPTLNIITNGIDPGFTGDEPEADIDTQWSGAAAPGATIDFVTSASTETEDGVDLSALYIVDNNLASIMSESYGQCELSLGQGGVDFYGAIWEQAAAQGISVMVSTGDTGAAGCDSGPDAQYGLNVSGLASTPWNAAIGGTDFNQYNKWSTYWNTTNTAITQQSVKTGTYIPETTWDNSCTNPLFVTTGWGANTEAVCNNSELNAQFAGGSGGESLAWLTPTWQTGIPNASDDARDLPDVSLFASNGFLGSFYIICEKDQTGGVCDLTDFDFLGYGGTSVATPAFAGIMALVNQKNGGPQGVPGLILYSLAAKQPNAFHDINILTGTTTTTISMPCETGTNNCLTNTPSDAFGVLTGWNTGPGYDLATGLGSVDAANLVNNWGKVTFTPSTATLTLNSGNPVSVTHGASVPVTVTVAPETGTGTPTGDVALLVNPGTPGKPGFDGFTLTSGTASWSTNLLPGGTYKVIAHYGGDTTFGGSYSAASGNITVNPETSSVSMPGLVTGVDQNDNPTYSTSVVYGTGQFYDYLLRADVFNSAGSSCRTTSITCPTGTIVFKDNNANLDGGTFTLNSEGYTEDQNVQLTGGSHTLKASYSGDASYKASSTSVAVTVTTAPTTISSVTANPASVGPSQNFTVTATIDSSSFGVAPTGAVTFLANGTALTGTPTYTSTAGNINQGTTAQLVASLTTSLSKAGTYTITATYAGDTNYATQASSPSAQVTVTGPSFTLAVTASPSTTIVNQSVMWSGTLTAVNGYNSNVTLSCTSGKPGTCSISPNPLVPTSGGAAFTVTVASATVGTFNFSIQGTDGTITQTQSVSLTVNGTFTVPGTLTNPTSASPGQTTTTSMELTPVGGTTFTSTVSYSCSGLPAGATCSFSPVSPLASGSSATNVMITVNTAGPFTGTASGATRAGTRSRAQNQNPRLWLPLTLPLAGVVLVGLGGGKISRRYKIVGLCLMLVLTGFMVACGGGSSGPPPVTISPTSAQVQLGGTQQFTASTSVTWSSTGAGSINPSSGLYTAPTTGTTPLSATVTATPTTGTAVTASVTIPAIGVSVSPGTVSTLFPSNLGAGEPPQTQQFTANVTNDSNNTAVTWAISSGGTTDSISSSGLYTAPASVPSGPVTVTATSQADGSKVGNATVNIQTPTPAGTYPITVTVTEGSGTGSVTKMPTFNLTVQ